MKGIGKSLWSTYWKLHDKKKMLIARLKGYLDGLPPKIRRRIVLAMLAAFAAANMGQIGYTLPDEGRIRWYGHLRTDCPCLQHSAKFSYA